MRPRLLAPFAAAVGLVLATSAPAWAGPGKKAEEALGVLVVLPGLMALFAYPVGLAFHALLLAYAPRRAEGLVAPVRHRAKTIVLGILNTLFIVLAILVTAKPAPGVAFLALATWAMLALVGSHGVARALGGRLLGHDPDDPPAPPGDFKALAAGWFVIVCGAAFPFIGPLLGAYWAVRGAGAVFLALFQTGPRGKPTSEADDIVDLPA